MTVATETYETTDNTGPNPGAIVAAIKGAARLRRGSRANDATMQRIKGNQGNRRTQEASETHTHKATFAQLQHDIGELALISENLRDRHGTEEGPDGERHDPIESRVEIIRPMSRRGHHLYRLDRVKVGLFRWKFRPFRPIVPKNTTELGMYMRREERDPNAPPDPNTVQYRTQRAGRAWVVKTTRRYAPDPQDNRGRVPFEPARYRPNDLIIEVPARGQKQIRSWLGGVEAFDEEPRAKNGVPRVIGTGPDGKGTFWSRQGFKGVSTGFHGDHALEDLTAIGHPNDIGHQTQEIDAYRGEIGRIKEDVLNRIAEEQGVSQRDIDAYAASKPNAPTLSSVPRP